jgi:CMP-N-acetylneuraminic acid synthetase
MDDLVKHIAVILARGGSKRLPGKNILEFHGKPMLAWTIEAALESGCYQRVLVSTDDPDIAAIARECGAQAPFLRQHAADDMAPSSEATLSALGQAEAHWGEQYQYVSQLMANCPLRSAADIRDSVGNFLKHQAPFQISCFRFGWMNPWWAAQLDEDQRPSYLFPEARTARSQDLLPLYCPSGAIWVAASMPLRQEGSFYGPDHRMHPISWMSAMDIDDAEDLAMAQACFVAHRKSMA